MFGKRTHSSTPRFPVPIRKIFSAENYQNSSDLVECVVQFVNHLFKEGCYRKEEIPKNLIELYHADFYVAQVLNGGHSQLIHNCGASAFLILSNAASGLAAMGATEHASLVRELAAWAEENPFQAALQTGFNGGRATQLDTLDGRFNLAQLKNPVQQRAAAWVRSWPEVLFVGDAEFNTLWRQAAMTNPKRSKRVSIARYAYFNTLLSDEVFVAAAIAADDAEDPVSKIYIRSQEIDIDIDIDEDTVDAAIFQTSTGTLRAVTRGTGEVRVYNVSLTFAIPTRI